MSIINLDHNATTPIDPLVLDYLIDLLQQKLANPSSIHREGQKAKQLLKQAKEQISSLFGVNFKEVLFTSGATEGLNLLIRGHLLSKPGQIISSDVEHPAVYQTLLDLQEQGHEVTFLSPGKMGAVTPEMVAKAITARTTLVALMAVNNETGIKTDIDSIAQITLNKQIPFIVDGVGWLGKEKTVLHKGVSAICFSSHKFHGPKGVGFAIVRRGFSWQSFLTGGGQEEGRRGGTENLEGILAMAKACQMAVESQPQAALEMERLRHLFEMQIQEKIVDVQINGEGSRCCNVSNLYFPGVDAETLLILLDLAKVMASQGSACSSGSLQPSRVLVKMGYPLDRVNCSVRFSLSSLTTQEEIEQAASIVTCQVLKYRQV